MAAAGATTAGTPPAATPDGAANAAAAAAASAAARRAAADHQVACLATEVACLRADPPRWRVYRRSATPVVVPSSTGGGGDPLAVPFADLTFPDPPGAAAAVLGGGTTATVVAATWHGVGVAVKRQRPAREIGDPVAAARAEGDFWAELAAHRRLRHPHIVALLGVVVEPGAPRCLLFERLGGGRLDVAAVCRSGTGGVLAVAMAIASAISYAHAQGILHRDLKPSNVLLAAGGAKAADGGAGNGSGDRSGWVAKVADWGLAAPAGSGVGVLTGETGTYLFMAPEVIRSEPYGPPADVFSFAILLWALLAGSASPYGYLTPAQAAVGVARRGLRPALPAAAHPGLADLVRACWAGDPAERPSFREVVATLGRLAAEERQAAKAAKSMSWFGW